MRPPTIDMPSRRRRLALLPCTKASSSAPSSTAHVVFMVGLKHIRLAR
jgi:hypothetical protein